MWVVRWQWKLFWGLSSSDSMMGTATWVCLMWYSVKFHDVDCSCTCNVLFICQTWVGPILLCVNPFEPPSAVTLSVLRDLVERLLSGLAEGSGQQRSVALVFSGMCGSGKSFTADQLLVKVFQTAHKTEWLQDLRKYWQVSSVVLKALGSAATQSNRESSRIVRQVDPLLALHTLSLSLSLSLCYMHTHTHTHNTNILTHFRTIVGPYGRFPF